MKSPPPISVSPPISISSYKTSSCNKYGYKIREDEIEERQTYQIKLENSSKTIENKGRRKKEKKNLES